MARNVAVVVALVLALGVSGAAAACTNSLCTSCQATTSSTFDPLCEIISSQLQSDCLSTSPAKYGLITGTTPSSGVTLPVTTLSNGVSVLGKSSRFLCPLVTSQVQVDCMNLAFGDTSNGQTEWVCMKCTSQLCYDCLKPFNGISASVKIATCASLTSQLQLDCLKTSGITDANKISGCLNVQTQQQVTALITGRKML